MVGKACVHLVHWTWQHAPRCVDSLPLSHCHPSVPLSMPSANRHTYWQSAWDRATAAAALAPPQRHRRRQLPLLFVMLLLQTIIYIHGQRLTQQQQKQQQEKKRMEGGKIEMAFCSMLTSSGARAAPRVRASKQNAQLVCKYWKYFSLFFLFFYSNLCLGVGQAR